MYVLVGLYASGHRGPAQTAQAEDLPGDDAGQALCHGKHHLVLFCLAHMYVASSANLFQTNVATN